MMKHNIFRYILLILTSCIMGACADDIIYAPGGEIPDGEGDITGELFIDMPETVNIGSRTAGNAVENISSLCVVLYDKNGNLFRKLMPEYTSTTQSDMPNDALEGDGAHKAESTTVRVKFTIKDLPYGEYYMYAVANMDNLEDYDVSTPDKLKAINVAWNSTDIAANKQMFGYFTPMNDSQPSAMPSSGFEAPLLTFKANGQTVHSWIKRTVSKVTVAYDGSGLHDDVSVYIHNVAIYDIPKECYIGMENKPTEVSELTNRPGTTLPASSLITYTGHNGAILADGAADSNNWDKWMWLANGRRNTDGTSVFGSNHSETAQALFFFENMQGDYKDDPDKEKYNKTQKTYNQPDGVGTHDHDAPTYDENGNLVNDYKDRVKCGTYIEVTGYYISQNRGNISQGPIKYRFMLGKNTTYNYEAQRNHHFKVTLGFKGWANQPDWHIEYNEDDPGIEVGPVVRVSYLYNTKATLPIKLNGNCTKLTLEIREDEWAPFDENTDTVPPAEVPPTGTYQFKWARNVYLGTSTSPSLNGWARPYLGFLAMQVPGNTPDDIPVNVVTESFQNKDVAQQNLRLYYLGQGSNSSGLNQKTRTFTAADLTIGKHSLPQGHHNNDWEVNEITDDNGNADKNSRMLQVPLWTRNKTMISGSGFSGNNPYQYYSRRAMINLTGEFEVNGVKKTVVEKCIVYQEPRIVNPTAVWRPYDKKDDFRVRLKRTTSSNAHADYEDLISDGTWRAYIEAPAGASFISLAKSAGTVGKVEGGIVYGQTGSPVDFTIKFNGTVGVNDSKFAIIRVEYHALNCVHKILVRQGYTQPVELGGSKWSSFSLYSAWWKSGVNDGENDTYTPTFTASPLSLGSFFRRGKQSSAIVQSNNETYPAMQPVNGGQFKIRYRDYFIYRTWYPNPDTNVPAEDKDKVLAYNKDKYMGLSTAHHGYYDVGSTRYRVPTVDDFFGLLREAEFAFGIVYGDGASTTADTFADATGYSDPDNKGVTSNKGSQCVIAYNPNNGNQVLFPIGDQGMGRRKQSSVPNATYNGTLWYAGWYQVLSATASTSNNWWRPIPYNLPIDPGAIYWVDSWVKQGTQYKVGSETYTLTEDCLGWDMNYFNFDFNPYNTQNITDACPMKLILQK